MTSISDPRLTTARVAAAVKELCRNQKRHGDGNAEVRLNKSGNGGVFDTKLAL
jgi:hypothetical protein